MVIERQPFDPQTVPALEAAIGDRTPFFASYEALGKSVRGQFDPGFENWCAENGKDPGTIAEAAAAQFSTLPEDVRMLAAVNDSGSRELVRSGLESQNTMVFLYSVQGLGRLQDWDAMPVIEKAAGRLPAAEHLALAMPLP